MSDSNPSIIFYRGLKCTKVPRASGPAIAVSSPDADSSPSEVPSSNSAVTLSIDTSPAPTGVLGTTAEPSRSPDTPTGPDSEPYSSGNAAQQSSTPTSGRGSDQPFQTQSTGLITSSVLPGVQTLSDATLASNPTATSQYGAQTEPSQNPQDASEKSNKGDADADRNGGDGSSLRTILGSTLGSLVFLALLILICVLVLRRKHSNNKKRSHGATERLLQSTRDSADSFASSFHQRYHSSMSVDPPLQSPLEPGSSSPTSWNPFPQSPPIPNMSEITPPPPAAGSGPASGSHRQADPHPPIIYESSAHTSQQSLGSTIILPGRSSSLLGGSSASHHEREGASPENPARMSGPRRSSTARFSSRSDPFDLEFPSTGRT